MDAKMNSPFIEAFAFVMPQFGFQNISRKQIAVKEKYVKSLGTTILVGITKQVHGNVAYNMPEDTAKYIASTMMCGMPVDDLNEMAQSAVAEMANMVTANAATKLSELKLEVDISTPSVSVGNGFSIKISAQQYLCVLMDLDGRPVELNIAMG